MTKSIVLIAFLTALTGCASSGKSMLGGVAIGGATGAALGSTRGKKGSLNGALIGAALGAGIGYLSYKDKKNKLSKVEQQKLNDPKDIPLLTRPKIKRIWVGDKVSGKRFIKGHWEYVIEEQSKWNKK